MLNDLFCDLKPPRRSSQRRGYAGPPSHLLHRPLGMGRSDMAFDAIPEPLTEQVRLRVEEVSRSTAHALIRAYHRHLWPAPADVARFAVRSPDGALRGGATLGTPVARMLGGRGLLEVTRVATDGTPNTCSALYGACCRWAKRRGYRAVVTYTLASEPGTSLLAAGFRPDGETDGGQWDRPGRARAERSGEVEAPKQRWVRSLR